MTSRINLEVACGLLLVLVQWTITARCQGLSTGVAVVSSSVLPNTSVPEPCTAEAIELARAIGRFPRSSAWQWVLVCDDAAWMSFLERSGRAGRQEILASTDLASRRTYVRGTAFGQRNGFGVKLEAVVAHELAHIWLNSAEDEDATALARRWMKAASLPQGSAVEARGR